jgi:hypothetical protein
MYAVYETLLHRYQIHGATIVILSCRMSLIVQALEALYFEL